MYPNIFRAAGTPDPTGQLVFLGFPEVLFLTTKMADMAGQPSPRQLPRVLILFLFSISAMIGRY